MADLSFYYCTACGLMSMKNFRDDCCPLCRVAMKVNKVNVYLDEPDHFEEFPAPHTEEEIAS